MAGALVQGMIVLDVDADLLRALDEFEGEYYVRNATRVVDGNGQLHEWFCLCDCAGMHLLTLATLVRGIPASGLRKAARATHPNF